MSSYKDYIPLFEGPVLLPLLIADLLNPSSLFGFTLILSYLSEHNTLRKSYSKITMNYYTATLHHRQNRRRERPGSRTRRTITRKASIQYDLHEGVADAHDIEVHLPSDKARPSPLFRQNFDQNWQRWKARQAEEKALAEMDRMQSEQEQFLLFGGELGDDVSLIPDDAMLGVVLGLFGDIDYIDP